MSILDFKISGQWNMSTFIYRWHFQVSSKGTIPNFDNSALFCKSIILLNKYLVVSIKKCSIKQYPIDFVLISRRSCYRAGKSSTSLSCYRAGKSSTSLSLYNVGNYFKISLLSKVGANFLYKLEENCYVKIFEKYFFK